MLTGRHAKHIQNYDYLNWVRIMHSFEKHTSVGKCDEVIKYSAPMFSSFSQIFAEFMR